MKKLLITSLLLSFVTMFGCPAAEKSSSESVQDTTAAAESTTEAETTAADPTTKEKKVYDYVHGEDGYYNIADEISDFKMKSQERRL